jgi:HAD superfamily hydrolase (TIGR01509 family)
MKPDARIYEIVEVQLGMRGGELLFIDDRPENVEGGARRGWRSICHRTPEETIAAARSWIN